MIGEPFGNQRIAERPVIADAASAEIMEPLVPKHPREPVVDRRREINVVRVDGNKHAVRPVDPSAKSEMRDHAAWAHSDDNIDLADAERRVDALKRPLGLAMHRFAMRL